MELITGVDFELSDAIKKQVHSKVNKIQQIAGEELKIEVHLHKEHKMFISKFHTHFTNREVVAEAENEDFYKSLNEVKEKMLRQIKEIKERASLEKRKPQEKT